jgi:hypothetical protein
MMKAKAIAEVMAAKMAENVEAVATAMAEGEAAEAMQMQREGNSNSGGKGGCNGGGERQWWGQWWQGQGWQRQQRRQKQRRRQQLRWGGGGRCDGCNHISNWQRGGCEDGTRLGFILCGSLIDIFM